MTNEEKQRFSLLTAALLAPPDDNLEADLGQPELRWELEEVVTKWGGSADSLSSFFTQPGTRPVLSALEKEYERLFLDPQGEMVSLVESTYKPWMTDGRAGMTSDGSKGLLMGDRALHMEELYRQCSIETPKELRPTPDHLVAELEFLALLIRCAPDEYTRQFVEDHLDWIAELGVEVEKAQAHPFYRTAVDVVRLFLANEVQRKQGCCHG